MTIFADFQKDLDVETKKESKIISESLRVEDHLGVIIRGHLYVESKIIELIENALPDPGAIDLTRLNFPTKLELASALRVFDESNKRPYSALNSLRNRLAHRFDTPFGADLLFTRTALEGYVRRHAAPDLMRLTR